MLLGSNLPQAGFWPTSCSQTADSQLLVVGFPEVLQRITGVDLTRIDGIDVMVAQTLVSEVGLEVSR